jgi:ABC-type transporter MlaC component
MKIITAVVLLAAALYFSPARGAAQTAAPAATVDPKIEAMAKDWLHRAQTNTLDRSQLTDQMNAQMTPDLAQKAAAQLGALGDYSSFTYVDTEASNGLTVYHFVVAFKAISLNEFLALTPDGKIAGLQFTRVQ